MKREDVYKSIDSERDYQDARWGSTQDEDYVAYPISQYIIDLEVHLNKLKMHGYNMDHINACEEIRKIGALAVKCGEVHGINDRCTR